ncbi:hypothetical protein OF83DRAFT_170480 [Amylostereum chailletii]|nr:hypothetical protein OF83DRAFT_170480 [Amylostereum chailletii]
MALGMNPQRATSTSASASAFILLSYSCRTDTTKGVPSSIAPYSMSNFAKINGKRAGVQDLTSLFLMDVNAYKISRLPSALYHDDTTFMVLGQIIESLGGGRSDMSSFGRVMKIYDNATQVRLPVTMPTAPEEYMDLYLRLLEQIAECKQSPSSHCLPTTDKATSILATKLPIILSLVVTPPEPQKILLKPSLARYLIPFSLSFWRIWRISP